MKKILVVIISFLVLDCFSQTTQHKPVENSHLPLKLEMYKFMRDSCTQLDIVYTKNGGSMSVDGRNVKLFTGMVDVQPAHRIEQVKDGFIMWQKNGREYITGDFYLTSDTSGFLIFKKDNKEFTNAFTAQGASFIRSKGGK